jgi:hypothetical protein
MTRLGRFRIWHDRDLDLWRWECTYCWPPAHGHRGGPGAWRRIVTESIPRHFRVRGGHHRWVARNAGRRVGGAR